MYRSAEKRNLLHHFLISTYWSLTKVRIFYFPQAQEELFKILNKNVRVIHLSVNFHRQHEHKTKISFACGCQGSIIIIKIMFTLNWFEWLHTLVINFRFRKNLRSKMDDKYFRLVNENIHFKETCIHKTRNKA